MSRITSGADGEVRFLDRAVSDLDSSLYTNVIFKGEQAYVSRNHFFRQSEASLKRKLFKNSVRRIAIEIFSYCNRTCYFCPNKAGGRLGDQKFLDEGIFLRILDDLASIEFLRFGQCCGRVYGLGLATQSTTAKAGEIGQCCGRVY